jgi:hypothetical protein
MPVTLDSEGAHLLEYLVRIAPSVDPSNLTTFPTYSGVHTAIGLQMAGRTWGDSLDRQGMSSLAIWANDAGYPAITGFIVDGEKKQPADGYFKFYGKDPDADGAWWLSEVMKAKVFSWPQWDVTAKTAPVASKQLPEPDEFPMHLQDARTVGDLASANSRFFLKSEWVALLVRVLMMHAMCSHPENRSAFQGQRTAHGKKIFGPLGCFVTSMCEKPMIPHADAEASSNPPSDHGKEECLPAEYKQRSQSTNMKHHHEECGKPSDRLRKSPAVYEDLSNPHALLNLMGRIVIALSVYYGE